MFYILEKIISTYQSNLSAFEDEVGRKSDPFLIVIPGSGSPLHGIRLVHFHMIHYEWAQPIAGNALPFSSFLDVDGLDFNLIGGCSVRPNTNKEGCWRLNDLQNCRKGEKTLIFIYLS